MSNVSPAFRVVIPLTLLLGVSMGATVWSALLVLGLAVVAVAIEVLTGHIKLPRRER